MSQHMPKLNIVKDLFHKMSSGEIETLTEGQSKTIQKLYEGSYSKKSMSAEIERRLEQNETLQISRQMTRKFESTRTIPSSPAEIVKYNETGEIERTPIGFKTPKPAENRYHMDTSAENIKRTKLERFDALFND